MSDFPTEATDIAPQPSAFASFRQLRREAVSLGLILLITLALAVTEWRSLFALGGYASSLVLLVLCLWHRWWFGIPVRLLPSRGDRWFWPLLLSAALVAYLMLGASISTRLSSRLGPSPLAAFHLLVLVPLSEELYFRGLLLAHLRKTFTAVQATLLCSVLFAILHFPFSAAMVTGVLSLIACFFVLKSGTLAYALQLHIAWNAIVQIGSVDVSSSRFNLAIFASAMIILLAIARLKTPRSVAHADAS